MKRKKFIFAAFILAVFIYGCYPISVTRMKWRIKWDKETKKGKAAFFEDNKSSTCDQKAPNIIMSSGYFSLRKNYVQCSGWQLG